MEKTLKVIVGLLIGSYAVWWLVKYNPFEGSTTPVAIIFGIVFAFVIALYIAFGGRSERTRY